MNSTEGFLVGNDQKQATPEKHKKGEKSSRRFSDYYVKFVGEIVSE